MKPRKLIVENIGPFRGREELDFTRLGEIFLVSGKTGSGKSTLFDAICYALYGSLAGSRKGQVRKLRSDFALEGEDSTVILDFELGNRTWRVERHPPYWRKKKRGGDELVESKEEAFLFELKGSEVIPFPGRKTEVDEKILSLVGLSADEFSKIVLLPQGEFAEFLRQGTNDRGAVLKKLFPVDLAVRVREKAQAGSREATARLDEAERALRQSLEQFKPECYPENEKAAEERLSASDAELSRLDAAQSALLETLRLAKALEQVESRHKEAIAEREALDHRIQGLEGGRQQLELSRRARPLSPLLSRATEAEEKTLRLKGEYSRAEEDLQRARLDRDTVRSGEEEAARGEAHLAELERRRGPLEEAVETEKRAADQKRKITQLSSERNTVREDIDRKAGEEEQAAGERRLLEKKAESLAELEARHDDLRSRMEEARILKPAAEHLGFLRKEAASIEQRLIEVRSQSSLKEKDLAVLSSELEEKNEERKRTEAGVTAAHLAEGLGKGLPCPVCGSLEHPAPASAPRIAFGLEERIQALTRFIEEGGKHLSGLAAEENAVLREKEKNAREQAQILRENPTAPAAQEVAAALKTAADSLTVVAAQRTEARRARDRLHELFRLQEEREARRGEQVAALHELDTRLAVLNEAALREEERRKKAIAALGNPALASAEEAFKRLTAQMEALARDIAVFASRRETSERNLTLCAERETVARKQLCEAEADCTAAQAELATALAATPLRDGTELKMALLSTEEERRIEGEIVGARESRLKAETREKEAEGALAQARGSLSRSADGDVTATRIEAELLELGARKEGCQKERDESLAAKAQLKREKAAWEEAEKRRSDLARDSAVLKRLSDDLSGVNPRKKTFDAWLLGLYLEEVSSYASHRLQRMSEGRYRLVMEADREGGRGLSGLDLAVFDAYTGKNRPCATLSGGESFMASISLALGLADSIQARSGGVRLDAIFIDEGFGSLDEASLDKAMTILDEIRDQRMVALISHVGEMKSRIPSRVEIVKTAAGSKIETPAC